MLTLTLKVVLKMVLKMPKMMLKMMQKMMVHVHMMIHHPMLQMMVVEVSLDYNPQTLTDRSQLASRRMTFTRVAFIFLLTGQLLSCGVVQHTPGPEARIAAKTLAEQAGSPVLE